MDGQMDRSSLCVCVQKFPTDKAYFIAKELLTTERTYLKDLQVITEVRDECLSTRSEPPRAMWMRTSQQLESKSIYVKTRSLSCQV